MNIAIVTIEHPTKGMPVEAVRINDRATLESLRGSEWAEGQLSLLSYPSAAVGYIGGEPPRVLSGQRVLVGDVVLKGPAGDFEVLAGAA